MTNDLRVELVFDVTCPNVARARAMIRMALLAVGAPTTWQEWDRAGADTPDAFRRLGSPTVLVNGADLGCDESDPPTADAMSCRVYVDSEGCVSGAPSSELIVAAIRRVVESPSHATAE